jgi:hypothetical protein
MQHVWRRGKIFKNFWWEKLREREHVKEPSVDCVVILRSISKNLYVRAWTGSSWLRMRVGRRYL